MARFNMLAAAIVWVLGPWLTLTAAHMEMSSPAPLRSKYNKNAGEDIDYSMTSPLSSSGSNYPCKGYLNLLGSPAGAPVATFASGSEQSVTISGGAIHGGGSCQISLSLDSGKSFVVIHSYIGNCPPNSGDSQLNFRIPSDVAATKEAILSWSWINRLGGQPEFYQNCAVVSITGGKGREDVAFNRRPSIFEANIGNGCVGPQSQDLMYPNPGPDVTVNNADAAPPSGSCEAGPGAPEDSQPARPDNGQAGGSPPSPVPVSPGGDGGNDADGGSSEIVGSGGDDSDDDGDEPPASSGNKYKPEFTKGNDWPESFYATAATSGSPWFLLAAILVLELWWVAF